MSENSDDESEDVFDDDLYKATAHTEIDEHVLDSIEKSKEALQKFMVNEFLTEAIAGATTIRNILGDADGYAYDIAESIRSNLLVVAMAVKADPGEFVLSAIRSCTDSLEANKLLDRVIKKVTDFKEDINKINK